MESGKIVKSVTSDTNEPSVKNLSNLWENPKENCVGATFDR
jgi:hypothetical protein